MARGNVKVVVAHKKSPNPLNKSLSRSIAGGSRIFATFKDKLRRKIFFVFNLESKKIA